MIATGPVDYESKEGDFTLRTISFKNVRNLDELYNQQELYDEVIVVRIYMLKSWKFEAANYMEICQKNLLTCLSQNFKTCKINILNEKKKFNHYYSIYI
jgi:hypothetical protein